jgi:hypothetical protein
MRVRELASVSLLLGLAALPGSVHAQRTGDQARLIFTVSGGVVIGRDLWAVGPQAVNFFPTPADSFMLGRRIRSNIAVGFGGTYFPGEQLGVAVEGFLIGLGFEDSCRQVFSSGSAPAAETCRSIQGATKSASAVTLSAGPVFRVNSRKLISPYARANFGLIFSNQSSLRMLGEYPGAQGTQTVLVYDDDHETRVSPSLALGVGFTAAVGKGYMLRWEARDNIAGVQRVTGTTPQAGVIPPHELEYKHLFSMTIGFDVVLERRKGRRY